MVDIAKIDGIAVASIAKINGIAVASIAKFNGQDWPASGPFSDSFEAADWKTKYTWYVTTTGANGSTKVARNGTERSNGTYCLYSTDGYLHIAGYINDNTDSSFTLDADVRINASHDHWLGLWYGAYLDASPDLVSGVVFFLDTADQSAHLSQFGSDGIPIDYAGDSYDYSGDGIGGGDWVRLQLGITTNGTHVVGVGKLMDLNGTVTYDTMNGSWSANGSWTTWKGPYLLNTAEPAVKAMIDYVREEAA